MKMRYFIFSLVCSMVVMTAMDSCGKKSTATDAPQGDSIDSVAAAPKGVEIAYDTTDATAFGLRGLVKQVITTHYEATSNGSSLVCGKRVEGYNDSIITFNEHGLVTVDAYANPYTYDENDKFVKGRAKNTEMKRDDNGHIISYIHQDKTEQGHWNSYSYVFEYDELNRMKEYTYTGWEEIFGHKFIYGNDDDLWPVKEEMEGQACADLFQSEILYRYLKFDDEGNWIEREVWQVDKQGVDDGSDAPEMESSNAYYIEKRQITYY